MVSARIRAECWDSHAAKGVCVTTAAGDCMVKGYGIRELTGAPGRAARCLAFLRRVEARSVLALDRS